MVHYRDDVSAGGSLRVGETIANNLDPARISAEFVFAYGGHGPVSARTKLPAHFIGAKGPKDFAAWRRARTLFAKLQPDIIHFQEGVVWLRTALTGMPGKKIVHVHGRYSAFHPPHRTPREKVKSALNERVSQTYFKSTDAQICINSATRDWLLDLGWITKEKSCVVYNAIDASRFASLVPRSTARAQLGLPQDKLLIGMICRLVWEKGCAEFLSILERLPERWHGVICGDGPLKADLQRDCEQRGLANRVHFLGSLDDVLPVYEAIHAYAFVSQYDGFGLAVAEAMAASVPVFGIARAGDYSEAAYPLITAENSSMVQCADDAGLEDAIQHVASHVAKYGDSPTPSRHSVESARAWVSRLFNESVQAEAMTRVYEDISSQGRPNQEWLDEFYQSKRATAGQFSDTADQFELAAATA
jgi:glycosyltransferase involved in cell wall biosynthesis